MHIGGDWDDMENPSAIGRFIGGNKMKKILSMMLIAILVLSLAGCGKEEEVTDTLPSEPKEITISVDMDEELEEEEESAQEAVNTKEAELYTEISAEEFLANLQSLRETATEYFFAKPTTATVQYNEGGTIAMVTYGYEGAASDTSAEVEE